MATLVDRVRELLELLGEQPSGDEAGARDRLRTLLTLTPAGALPPEAWPLLEALWAAESAARRRYAVGLESSDGLRAPAALRQLGLAVDGATMSLWRGDITTLEVDAIVNAANASLTGCYVPRHPCVDNAIHTAAGPWLREACARVMRARARPEPPATATVTPGFFLPARRVVHTVGPIVAGGRPGPEEAGLLRGCYRACLEAAAEEGLRSLAFCGISTGVFGYPAAEAARIAVGSVRGVLGRGCSVEHVIFVTFSDRDEVIYASLAEEVCS